MFNMNKYEIIQMIDEGAYGIVWKAINKTNNQLVAIKELKDNDEDDLMRKNIQRQISMLKMLRGEYVVCMREAYKKNKRIFLIFEYIPNNLLNLIEISPNGLNSKLIARIIYRVVKCLRYVHSVNVMHRDIKPENILLDTQVAVLKLCDFGFTRFVPSGEEVTEYVATRWYRSPELLVGETYGRAADVWALGCILGELVDGQPMFPGNNQMDQISLIRKTVGEITETQISTLKRNRKFEGVEFPALTSKHSLEARYLGKIQKRALNFLKMCLTIDPEKRITMEQALKHPYLQPYTKDDDFRQENAKSANLIYHIRNESKLLKQEQENTSVIKTKLFPDKGSLKMAGISMPESSLYRVVKQAKMKPIVKKVSEANIQGSKVYPLEISSFRKYDHQLSPKLKIKKGSPQAQQQKLLKIMSQEKKKQKNKNNSKVKLFNKARKVAPNKLKSSADMINLPQLKINTNSNKVLKYQANIQNSKKPSTIYRSGKYLNLFGVSKEFKKD